MRRAGAPALALVVLLAAALPAWAVPGSPQPGIYAYDETGGSVITPAVGRRIDRLSKASAAAPGGVPIYVFIATGAAAPQAVLQDVLHSWPVAGAVVIAGSTGSLADGGGLAVHPAGGLTAAEAKLLEDRSPAAVKADGGPAAVEEAARAAAVLAETPQAAAQRIARQHLDAAQPAALLLALFGIVAALVLVVRRGRREDPPEGAMPAREEPAVAARIVGAPEERCARAALLEHARCALERDPAGRASSDAATARLVPDALAAGPADVQRLAADDSWRAALAADAQAGAWNGGRNKGFLLAAVLFLFGVAAALLALARWDDATAAAWYAAGGLVGAAALAAGSRFAGGDPRPGEWLEWGRDLTAADLAGGDVEVLRRQLPYAIATGATLAIETRLAAAAPGDQLLALHRRLDGEPSDAAA